ncbi:Fungal Zn(2)-Cys(6) binuclear cluster domain-containing protein 18 [Elsinoe fawcettii]|nr:Fungal Zn(2)-Cys(6) binuclear cluster domain-containing protein 18 [Elsinoe fawcettii]
MAQPPKLPSLQQLAAETQSPPASAQQPQHSLPGVSQQPPHQPQQYAPSLPPLQGASAPPQPSTNGAAAPPPPPHQQQPPAPMYGNGHPPPPPSVPQYTPTGVNGTNGATNGHHRVLYPIPPQNGTDVRPPKREIKRRTKTGCLTCRKRRIKCDEGHPACRNCVKSKRECLGYDPIFKSSGLTPAGPREGVQIQAAPQVYASTHPQTQLPPPGYSTLPPAQPPHQPAEPAGEPMAIPATASQPQHEAPLDPALHANPAADPAPPDAAQVNTAPAATEPYTSELRTYRLRKHFRVDQLFVAKTTPSYRSGDEPKPSETEVGDIRGLFSSQYGPALNSFFETTWYTDHGDAYLFSRPQEVHFFIHASRILRQRLPHPQPDPATVTAVEMKLVWHFAALPRIAWEIRQAADTQLADLLHRLDVIEHLITGAVLPVNLIPPAPLPPKKASYEDIPTPEFLAHSFWHHLGMFTAQDDTSRYFNAGSQTNRNITDSMGAMRQILSVLENRDVLYSIAIARHIGGRLTRLEQAFPPSSRSQDPEEPLNKFGVAWKFLGDEEVGGTTGVVRSIASLARKGVFRGRVDEAEALRQNGNGAHK